MQRFVKIRVLRVHELSSEMLQGRFSSRRGGCSMGVLLQNTLKLKLAYMVYG
jgi:hypothetical protein